ARGRRARPAVAPRGRRRGRRRERDRHAPAGGALRDGPAPGGRGGPAASRGGAPADVRSRSQERRGRHRGARVTLSRRASRRTAFFLLYQWDVTGQPLASLYEGEVDEFARETAEAVAARVEQLDRRITAASEGWTADRLGAVERNILRLATYELDEGSVPLEVAIDEAVTLAKRYATVEAGRLVNGILGRIAREQEVA